MTDVKPGVSRGQFIKNAAKGSVVLVGTGGVLASMEGVAFAKSATKSDVATLQVAYIAESLAVKVYSTIIANFSSFKGLQNKDYFVAALKNEKDHKAFLAKALGSKTPSGFTLHIPKAAVASTHKLLGTGVALETAFVETYLGAVGTLSSTELKQIAAKVAANEASHFSFFDAAFGGHGVLPSLPSTITAKAAAATLTKDGFIS
jgi:rubrerythrin